MVSYPPVLSDEHSVLSAAFDDVAFVSIPHLLRLGHLSVLGFQPPTQLAGYRMEAPLWDDVLFRLLLQSTFTPLTHSFTPSACGNLRTVRHSRRKFGAQTYSN